MGRRTVHVLAATVVAAAAAGAMSAGRAAAESAPVPTITGVSPTVNDYLAQPVLTVTGTGFDQVSSAHLERYDYLPITSISPTSMQVKVPPMAPGHYHLQVVTHDGQWSATTPDNEVTFTRTIPNSPWDATDGPRPAGVDSWPHDFLRGVSCADVEDCAAYGSYLTPNMRIDPLLATSTDGTWTALAAPLPRDIGKKRIARLLSVSCGAVGNCASIGNYNRAHVGATDYLERLSDGSWRAEQIPLPSGVQADKAVHLHDLSCAGLRCIAVGDSAHRPSITTLQDGEWHTRFAPLPARAGGRGHLYSVSCPTSTYCVAVGLFRNAQNHADYLVDTFANGSWTAQVLPLPLDALPRQSYKHHVAAVSCGSVGFCAAVGEYRSGDGASQRRRRAVLSTRVDGSWTSVQAGGVADNGQPFTGQQVFLTSVSCAPSQTCAATSIGSMSSVMPVVETFDGGTWSGRELVVPADRPDDYVLDRVGAVSCYAPGRCVITGSYQPKDNPVRPPLFDTLVDGAWTPFAGPMPSGFGVQANLDGAWCAPSGACVVVGLYTRNEGLIQGGLDWQAGMILTRDQQA